MKYIFTVGGVMLMFVFIGSFGRETLKWEGEV